MKSFWVYILYSKAIDRFYVGYTENLESRVFQHNNHVFKGSFTDKAEDWEIFFSMECASETQAISIEKHIKRNKSRKYFANIRQYSEISQKLWDMYK